MSSKKEDSSIIVIVLTHVLVTLKYKFLNCESFVLNLLQIILSVNEGKTTYLKPDKFIL